MEEKWLKPYKGYNIVKTYEVDWKGRVMKDTVIYCAVDHLSGTIWNSSKTLQKLKKVIDVYVEREGK